MELLKCLKCIKEHAFVKSEYPVVITLEDHLTPDLQAKVAEVSIYFLLVFQHSCSINLQYFHQFLDGHSNI